jgi:rhamnose transport system ATP-binding protein
MSARTAVRESERSGPAAGDPVVGLRAISKSFASTKVVDAVDLDLRRAEVHGLVGENGAGKSTLMRILGGFFPDYVGEISLDGAAVRLVRPRQARTHGIALVHQELSLLPELTVAENILLGREPSARLPGFISRQAIEDKARMHLGFCGIRLDPAAKVDRLSIAERQLVEIVRGVAANPRVLILDEPSSSLTYPETRDLFGIIRRLVARGTAVVYISHKLDEIFALAGWITVLRDGRKVASAATAEWTEPGLVRAMVGRDLSALFPRGKSTPGKTRLQVSGLARRGWFRNLSFEIRAGEIVGLYGLVGSGRTGLAEALYGLSRADAGSIRIDGRATAAHSPAAALRAGIAMVPEDRRAQGLVPMLSVQENLSLSALPLFSTGGFIQHQRERIAVDRLLKSLLVRATSPAQEVATLSGGNQQKIVLGRALMVGPKVLILDEPTRGIDVVAKAEVHGTIDRLAQQGMAVLLISSELPEILGMCDRILVMRDGDLVGQVARERATEEHLLSLAAGVGAAPQPAVSRHVQ